MILVVGATGQLGGTIARRLIAGGAPVRVLVRPETDPGAHASGLAQLFRGDLRDRASLDAACAGVTTVITTPWNALGSEDRAHHAARAEDRAQFFAFAARTAPGYWA